jgi:hypothetical protein
MLHERRERRVIASPIRAQVAWVLGGDQIPNSQVRRRLNFQYS